MGGPVARVAGAAVVVAIGGACLLPRATSSRCAVVGEGNAADVALARRMCLRVERRFFELTGSAAPAGRITLTGEGEFVAEVGGGAWRLQWPTTPRLVELARLLGRNDYDLEESWQTVLPHELGHVMLAAHLYANQPELMGQGYGTPLPDWLDEGVAVWMETDRDRGERLRQAALLAGGQPVRVAAVLGANHPLAATRDSPYATRIIVNGPCECPERPHPDQAQRIVYRYYRDGRTAAETTYVAGAAALDEPEARFYAQSYALLAWVRERGGAAAIREVFSRARRDPRTSGTLLENLPLLPTAAGAIDDEWGAWLAGQIRSASRR